MSPLEGPCPFDICDGTGFVTDEETRAARACRCRPQRISRGRTASLSAVIPRKYRGVSLDRPPVTSIAESAPSQTRFIRGFIADLDVNLDAGRGVWLFGDVGTGKTTMAMLISKAAIDAGRSVAIYSLPRLLSEIRATFDDDNVGSYTGLLDRLAEVDLLHIDDVGAEKTSEWVLEQLYAIVNARYEEQRSVIITTNLQTREELAEQITLRTVSRLEEMCEVLPLSGADRRRQIA